MILPPAWRAELARQGFHDIEKPDGTIEDGRAPLTRHSSERWNAEEYDALAEYYRLAGVFLHEHTFRNDEERAIWELHAEGASYTRIHRRVGCYRRKVHAVVTRLRAVMLGDEPRPMPGRPRSAGSMREQVRLRLSDAHLQALEQVSRAMGIPAADAIRQLIAMAAKQISKAA